MRPSSSRPAKKKKKIKCAVVVVVTAVQKSIFLKIIVNIFFSKSTLVEEKYEIL